MQNDLETYIVQVKSPESQISTQSSRMDLESGYKSFMPKTIETADSDRNPRLIYSYHNVIIGFAERLSAKQVKEMEKKPGFISAWPQRILSLNTTHTLSFLGLHQNVGLWRDANYGKGVIIGVLDTEITPDHPSFSNEGMPPPPAKWKGKCELNFTKKCNNKLISARNFPISSDSPIDNDGHGTHTSSIAAGSFVKDANEYGNAKGTAVGIAPLAPFTRDKGQVVKDAGGIAMTIYSFPEYGLTTSADAHVLPALFITYKDGIEILDYLNSTINPIARISFQGTIIGDKDSPVVSAFSARGPSYASPGILKPDIIGPGRNILAAWLTSVDYKKHTKSIFNILLGTSMSCPHLSGVAAFLKSTHPTWSPAAIKSAIMTTANILNLANDPFVDERLLPANIFAIGAGHVNPSRANDPRTSLRHLIKRLPVRFELHKSTGGKHRATESGL
ncbi:hypothetical protein RDI58_019248 [Solanum bulbocastanum]|uniref:Uncharacterized protein n=1 Tax=Solanum bulbocastanum TaxID=147425 RepID=A0AAN8Y6V1_SOLBU